MPGLKHVNWVSTQIPMWQIDCETYRKAGRPFELRDVSSEDHLKFVEFFCSRYALTCEKNGTTVRFLIGPNPKSATPP